MTSASLALRRLPAGVGSGLFLVIGLALAQAEGQPPPAQEPRSGGATENVLTQAVQVLSLSEDDAKRAYPIQLRGVVTCFDRRFELCFIQDGTAGVYVFPRNASPQLKAGDSVEVSGRTGAGRFSSIVDFGVFKLIGPGRLPAPKAVSLADLASGGQDCQWVQVEGVVQRAAEGWEHLGLELVAGSSRLPVWVSEYPQDATNKFLDARVRLQGVAGTSYHAKGQLVGFQLYVPGAEQISMVEPPVTDPFTLPVRPVRAMLKYSPVRDLEHRIHLRGVVTFQWPGRRVFLKDTTGGLQVDTWQGPAIEPGDLVDVVGFPVFGSPAPTLANATLRKAGKADLPQPVSVTFKQTSSGDFNNELVQTEGALTAVDETALEYDTLVLQADKAMFNARLPKRPGQTRRLSTLQKNRLQLVGVCAAPVQENGNENAVVLWLRSPADIKVLERLPDDAFAESAWIWLAAGVILVSALGWAVASGRQAKSALIRSERQLRKVVEERERIARDLHDGIIQSIYAVGLNLENAKRMTSENPVEAEKRLTRVLSDLNAVIREVRNFILGLESDTLKGPEFKTALKSLVLTLGETGAPQFQLQIDSEIAANLTPKQATQLLHIAREAVSNSVRHAQAERIVLSLQPHQGLIRFEVQDNGVGFDSNSEPSQGHGLRNIAARARELDARLSVVSRLGHGTGIVLDISPKIQHQSA